MKHLILALALAAGSRAAFAQGTFIFDNVYGSNPPSTSLTATSAGAFFINGVELSAYDPNAFYGTVVANGVTLASNTLLDVGVDGELVADSGYGFIVPGVPPGGVATITVTVWEDLQGTGEYAAGDPRGTATFNQILGGVGVPPSLPAYLTSMPAVNLLIPEPGSFALMGLGATVLLMRRRR